MRLLPAFGIWPGSIVDNGMIRTLFQKEVALTWPLSLFENFVKYPKIKRCRRVKRSF